MPFRHRPMSSLASRLVLGALLACTCSAVLADEAHPNIVFIMADDLGYGHLGCYGQKQIKTPNIDRLAAEGIRFTNAYAGCTVCAPSRSVLMTGLHMGHTPIRWNGGGTALVDEDVTIAEVLASAGYTCGGFGKWGLGVEGSSGHPNRQGFDEFLGYLHQVHAHFFYPYYLWHNETRHPLPANEGVKRGQYSHDVIVDAALDFIQTNKDRPFFCYMPVTIPHVELAVPDDSAAMYRGKFKEFPLPDPREGYIDPDEPLATFAGMITRMDDGVGRVLALLEKLNLDERTIVFFTSDNGAQGATWQPLIDYFNGTGGLRDSKGALYEGGIRVPLIARWTKHIAPGRTSDLPCCFYDMLPTLAELAGAKVEHQIDGLSLVPTLLDEGSQAQHEYLYWEHYQGATSTSPMLQAVRSGKWKLVQPRARQPFELYDLAADPHETTNLAATHADVLERLKGYAAQSHTTARDYPPDQNRPTYRDYVR